MHKLIFKEVSFRNFMSYGSTLNKFTFKEGLTWVHGDNGFGKSTIVEAMTFALLGTSYRGGTKADLRNSKNFNPDVLCHTEVDFMSHRNHGNHRKIYVTRKPRKSQKDICHTETTENTEKYISARF